MAQQFLKQQLLAVKAAYLLLQDEAMNQSSVIKP